MQLVLRIVEYPKINFGWDAVVALFRYLKNPSYRLGPIWFRRLFLIGVSAGGGLIQGEFIVMFYGPILLSLHF